MSQKTHNSFATHAAVAVADQRSVNNLVLGGGNAPTTQPKSKYTE